MVDDIRYSVHGFIEFHGMLGKSNVPAICIVVDVTLMLMSN